MSGAKRVGHAWSRLGTAELGRPEVRPYMFRAARGTFVVSPLCGVDGPCGGETVFVPCDARDVRGFAPARRGVLL